MNRASCILFLSLCMALAACTSDAGESAADMDPPLDSGALDMARAADLEQPRDLVDTPDSPVEATIVYEDVTETHLPVASLQGLSMDAVAADFDGDGDQDLVIAHEYRRTIFLLNDGTGVFEDASARFPDPNRDSEDLAVTDWDGDGALDVLIVSEDDTANELFLQRDGAFVDASERLPNEGISNGVAWAKLAGDDVRSVFVGNNGQNRLWVEDGQGGFVDATDGRMPVLEDATQDLELGDLDGDGDLDLVVGNEGDNLILFQDAGVFTLAPDGCLPLRQTPEETRDVELGDIDADGDLDLVFGNVLAFVPGASPLNRVLVNQGDGCFTDETAERWQTGMRSTFDADLIDVDADGDLDLVTGNLRPGLGLRADGFRVFVNDGEGVFTEATDALFGGLVEGKGFDIEAFDADGDGDLDLYFASRGAGDRLYLRRTRSR